MYKNLSFNPVERLTITYAYTFAHNALTPEECDKALELCRSYGLTRGTVGGGKNEKINDTIRRSNVNFIGLDEKNKWLFDRIAIIASTMNDQFYNFNLNGFEKIQFTEYCSDESGYYDWHIDCFLGNPDPAMQAMRKLSISILLNDDFEGGEFEVHLGDTNNNLTPEVKKGSAIVFPSFVGHRVKPVTKGNRYSLVVWVYGPKFI